MIFNLILCLTIIILYFILNFGNADKKAKNNLFLKIVFISLFIIVGMREMTRGNDTLSYIKFFKLCSNYKWKMIKMNSYYETGYVILNIILSYFIKSSRIFLLVFSGFINYTIFKFIKNNSKNYLFSVLLYICLLYFYQSMTMFRQFLALCVILNGFKYIKSKKFIKFLVCILIATSFHSSSLIAIFLYPLYLLKYDKKIFAITFSSSLVFFFFLGYIYPFIASFMGKEDSYLDTIGNITLANSISTLIFLILFLFCLVIVKKDNRKLYSFSYYALFFAFSLYLISIKMPILSRAAQYYSIFAIINVPTIIEQNIKLNKIIYSSIIILLFLLYSSCIMVYRPEWNSAYNYKSCIIEKNGYICNY